MMDRQPNPEPRRTPKSAKTAKTSKAAAPRTRRPKPDPELAIAGQVLALNPGQVELVKALVAEFSGELALPQPEPGSPLRVEAALPGLSEFWLHQLEDLAARQRALQALFEAS